MNETVHTAVAAFARSSGLLACALAAAGSVHAAEIERLPGHVGGFSSASRMLVADDFTVSTPARLLRVSWVGGYETAGVDASQQDRFVIVVLGDREGRPARPLAVIRAGQVERSATGDWVNPPDGDGTPGRAEYAYTYTLETPLDLRPGTWWLSIVNAEPGSAERRQWLWEASDGGDGVWRRTGFDREDWERHPGGTAFSLDLVSR